jgi:hypothetical protein
MQLAYDAANGRLLAFGGGFRATCKWQTPDDLWAFDIANGSWTLVLPPTPVPPPVRDLAAERAPASDDPDRSPWIHAERVTLHGGAFFTRAPGVADQPLVSTPPAEPASVVDGLLLPDCQEWTDGTVWWEETADDTVSRAWIEIDLGGMFVLDAAMVQADVGDSYLLSYRDPGTAGWVSLWSVPPVGGGMLATRPRPEDASVRWPFAQAVTTDALRFEATDGDAQYSVSEIAVFGHPAP